MQPVNETLGSYSDLLMLIAALIYLVAFFFFCWDMASSSKAIRRIERDLAGAHAEQLEQDAAYAATKQKARTKTLVGAGASTTTEEPDTLEVRSEPAGPQDRIDIREGKASSSQTTAGDADSAMLVSDDMEYASDVKRPAANIAVAIMVFAALVHTVAVVARGIAANRVPWSNLYEFVTTGALIISLVYLVFLIRKDLRFVGSFVSGLVVLMMCFATIGWSTPVATEQPALQSWWLVIHVSVAVAATAIFSLTFAMSVLQLLKQREEARAAAGLKSWAFLKIVPSSMSLENWSYRLNAVGFVMWTFTLIAGAIWAEQAWGRYWGWDAKEVWSFVIWVVYAGYLHARATRGWTGTRSAWLNMAGFACLVFNYTAVNFWFPSLHSYAGV